MLIRFTAAEILRDHGFAVVEAACGDEAVALLDGGLEPALVVTDIRMPGSVDGLGLLDIVTRRKQDLPVLVASSHLPLSHDRAQAVAFLSKPISRPCSSPWFRSFSTDVTDKATAERKPAILVADSDVLVRHAIADYLRDCGYSVIEASNGDEAITVLGEHGLSVDAVLAEAELRGAVNGFALRQWVLTNRPDIDVVLSGSIASAANGAAQLCEDGPHLGRPYDPQGVVDYIKRLLAKRASARR